MPFQQKRSRDFQRMLKCILQVLFFLKLSETIFHKQGRIHIEKDLLFLTKYITRILHVLKSKRCFELLMLPRRLGLDA